MTFRVTRLSEAMVQPCDPTPTGTLELSAIDKISNFRVKVSILFVFRYGNEAAKVITEALSKTLVLYYPLAGRLKELPCGELQIACTGEGVWFMEASADCSLHSVNYFHDVPIIPHEKLLPTPPPGIYAPLMQIQLTRFTCKGFAMGLTILHTVCDGLGTAQFLHALGEFARGSPHPRIAPVWHREAVLASPTLASTSTLPLPTPNYNLQRVFITISIDQINKLKNEFVELTGKHCSSADAVAASIWRHRTQAIDLEKDANVNLVLFVNARQFMDPPLPEGFYGNCIFPVIITISSGWVVEASNAEVVKLIKDAKARAPDEFKKWLKNDGNDPYNALSSYTTLSILQRQNLGYNQVDYGWGQPVNVLPIERYSLIPVVIVGLPPTPKKGICLTTWCVNKKHLPPFLQYCTKAYISRL
ncbi:hypothetical protein AQUCO_00300370v1 [Aquilegia coerulea]|uniref:Uncharacterized protein n=1 Tax=Aquilegia coerulea TaxID=218851 RepID=A0A2G5EYJ7_AQUCA|nr:hypothetical protein AQUCO_00300370v1 [Aquilegia coerulea]